MSDDDNTFSAVVRGVHVEKLGDTLAVAAAIGDTVLTVNNTADFDEEGGFLRLRGVVYEYLSCDDEANTITLAAALPVVASVDTKIDVWDDQNGQPAALHKAVVDQIDGFDGVATVVVKQSVAHALSQNMRDGKGESVTLKREPGGEIHLADVHGRAFALAGLQYLQGGMTTRQAEDDAGVDILGVDSGTPGLYLFDTGGRLAMLISDDAAGGVIKFWTGDPAETFEGYINPAADVGGPFVEFGSPQITGGSATRALVRLYPGSGGGETNVYQGDLMVRAGQATVNGKSFLNDDTAIAGALDVEFAITGNSLTTGGAIHSGGGGIWMDDLTAGGTTTAQIGNSGRIVRATLGSYTTSMRELKADIRDMTLAEAAVVYRLRPRTYLDKADLDGPRLPGFIVDEAEEAGADLWVGRNEDGKAEGFRYQHLTAALTLIVQDQQRQIDDLTARLTALETRDV